MKYAFLLGFLLLFYGSNGQAFRAGNQTKVSILTADGGTEIYNTFGHTAIRIVDTTQQVDVVFNYGTFNFGEPNFILNFIHGRLDYFLSVENTSSFVMTYVYQNRSLHQQFLNLDTQQINQLIEFLVWNAKPENRVYRYDFLFDNCATRVRDIFIKDSTSYQINYTTPQKLRSFRKLIHHYAYEQLPWLDWGMDLLLGLSCDKTISDKEYTFLPAYIFDMFDVSKNIKTGALVGEKNELFTANPVVKQSSFLTPFFCNSLFLVFCIVITYLEWTKKIKSYRWDILWMLVLGILGVVMGYEWFFTEHTVTKNNLNMIWASPFWLVMIYFYWRKNKLNPILFGMMSLLMILFTVAGYIGLQPYHAASLPLIAAVALRCRKIVATSLALNHSNNR